VEAQAEQANEHNKKQDDVNDEDDDRVEFGAADVDYNAGAFHRCPRSADLRIR